MLKSNAYKWGIAVIMGFDYGTTIRNKQNKKASRISERPWNYYGKENA
jgi:hypothetical protein